MKINRIILALAIGGAIFSSCAKEKNESANSIQKRILQAYIAENYPGAEVLPSGLAIISKSEGIGEKAGKGYGCYIHYDTYSLEGVCQSTTDSVKAKELGSYSAGKYYGPSLFLIGEASTTAGMSELLTQVAENGEVTAVIPPWLTGYGASYMGSTSSGQEATTNILYKVKMGKVFKDLLKFQLDSLEAYSKKNFSPKIDSLASGFYFRNFTHSQGIAAADTIKSGTKVSVWYVGRLLDGYIFDTNIADTAKKYGLYSSSSTYEPLSVEIKESYFKMSSGSQDSSGESSGSLVPGFARALKKMTIGDSAVTFFYSSYGYGSSGNMSSGKGVPNYAMLRFDIMVEAK